MVDNEQLEQILANAAQWPTDLPVEDLTGEVQDLMMRYTKKFFFTVLHSKLTFFVQLQIENQ